MKKVLKAGKKPLSLFLAVVMLITTWVFVAPTTAGAATAGNYYIRVTWANENTNNINNSYKGFNSEQNDSVGISIGYKATNGTASSISYYNYDCKGYYNNSGSDEKEYTFDATLSGFPTLIYAYIDDNYAFGKVRLAVKKLQVGSSASNLKTVWTGRVQVTSQTNPYAASVAIDGTTKKDYFHSDGETFVSDSDISNWKTPAATTVGWSNATKSITVPKTGTATVTTDTATVKDQYGVNWYQDAYYALNTTSTASTTSATITGITRNTNATNKGTVSVTNAAKDWVFGANSATSRDVYLTAYIGSKTLGTTKITVNNVKYKHSLDGNGGTVISPSAKYVETEYKTAFGADPLAEWTGYRFLGFYSDKQDTPFTDETSNPTGTKLDKDTTVTEDKDWYAAWRANEYEATFQYMKADGTMVTEKGSGYVGQTIAVPSVPESVTVDNGDTIKHFTGWKLDGTSTVISKDATSVPVPVNKTDAYKAQYDDEPVYADYKDVNDAIAAVDDMKAADPDFNDRYTEDSLNNLNAAINDVVRDLRASQQNRVNDFAKAINNAKDALKVKHFTVLFVDDDGTIIKDGYHYVEYGKRIDVPTTPVREPDATYHYEFSEWRTADRLESAEVQAALEKVTADYRFVAKFNRFTHDYSGKPEVIESTCTVNGSLKYTCPGCGMTKVVANPDDIASHDFSRQVVVEATCSTNGATAMVCKDCGVYEEGTLEIVDKLEHNYGTWTTLTPATCWGKGTEKRTCANCDAYEVRETEKLDHAWDRDAEGADENGWVNVAATCEADGYKYRTCTACQLVERVKTDDKLDHPAANRKVDEVVATCKNAGYRLETCGLCGKVISFTTTEQLTTHTWKTTVDGKTADADGWVTVIAKSCTQKEVKKRVCSVCGKEEVSISADFLPHTEIIDAAVAATCTHTGLTEGKHCDVCKQVLEAQTETPALGHKTDVEWTEKSAATCQSDGYAVKICDRVIGKNADGTDKICGEIIDTKVLPKLAHQWNYADDAERWEEVTAATCTEDGLEKRACTATTGHPHEETRVIPKTGHNMGTTVHAPTCTAYGYTEYGCLNDCDLESYQSDFVAPLGHDWNDGVITKEATCTENGVMTYKCNRDNCGATKTEVIPNNGGHNYVEDSAQYVEPTNSANGKKVLKCSKCGDEITVIIPAQGHEFEIVNTDPATCTKDGKEYYDCKTHTGDKDCGLEYTNTIPALGHDMVLDLSDARTKEATCTEDGLQVFKCNRTGCTHEELVTVPKLGHDLKFVKKVPVSCQEYGYDLYECDRCGVQVKIFDMRVEPGNDHHWTEIQYHVDPTCVERGFDVITCRVCGASYRDNFVDALGHAWDEGHHIDPTCTKPGGTLYTCTRSHTDVDKDGKPITTACGATKLEDEEPALGHDMGQWYFAPDGDHYVNKRDCNREGCPYSEYEKINDEKVVYYKVDFVSYKYVGEYYTAGDGTKLAYSMDEQPDAYKEVVVDTQYIKSGEPCEYAGEKLELPKTKAFGVYNLTGWKLDKGDLSNVTTNITAKAQFQGEDIYYEVNFYSYDGHLVKGPVHVLHGQKVALDDRPLDEYVTRPTNNQYKYEFTGKWDRDIEAIYATGPIHAVFKQIPLTYKVVFHDWDGKVVATQILGYGEGVNDATKAAFSTMKRDEDDAYIYEWTPASRRWVDAKGNIIDENHVKVPDNQGYQEYTPEKEKDEFLSDREKGIFHVYASYPQKIKYYRFNVSAKYADGSIAEGATVTVQSPDGQLVYTTKLNEKGTATVTVEHYEYVTVNITGGGETNSLKIGLGKDNIVDGYFGNEGDEIPSFAFELSNYVDPDPDHGGSTKCRCICHTFLGGLWINFLNILYRLFGKKTVCCHDMYEKHGDRLAYGK